MVGTLTVASIAESDFIKLQGLNKGYTEGERIRPVLDNLNLSIQRGEFLALLGRSGSGKSTLLNLLAGIDRPDSGRIEIDGLELTGLDETTLTRWRRRYIGFVFQFFNLIPTLTVAENVRLPLQLNGKDDTTHRRQADVLLRQVGLAGRGGSFPEHLSGGEQQRLAIVRALIHEPMLLLADEPTGNLDGINGNQALDLLVNLSDQFATTVVMVTHSREAAARAERVLQLHEGQLQSVAL